MKIRTEKLFKQKVLECAELVVLASRTPKTKKYVKMGIYISRYDTYQRVSTGAKDCKIMYIEKQKNAYYHHNLYTKTGLEYQLSSVDKGTFFNALIQNKCIEELFWECVTSEVLKLFNHSECYTQEITIHGSLLLAKVGVTL